MMKVLMSCYLICLLMLTFVAFVAHDCAAISNEHLLGCIQDDIRYLAHPQLIIDEPTVDHRPPAARAGEDDDYRLFRWWEQWVGVVGSPLFLFGEGPMEVFGCAAPFHIFDALHGCRHDLSDDDRELHNKSSVLDTFHALCSEPRHRWVPRLLRCIEGSGGRGGGDVLSSLLLLSHRASSVHRSFCRLSSSCTLEGLDRVCTIVVSAAQRRRNFCNSMKSNVPNSSPSASYKRLTTACRRRWPMVKVGVWENFTRTLVADAYARVGGNTVVSSSSYSSQSTRGAASVRMMMPNASVATVVPEESVDKEVTATLENVMSVESSSFDFSDLCKMYSSDADADEASIPAHRIPMFRLCLQAMRFMSDVALGNLRRDDDAIATKTNFVSSRIFEVAALMNSSNLFENYAAFGDEA